MPRPIEQEAPAHTQEAPVQTPVATDHAHEAALLKSLENMLDRLAHLERQAILMAVRMDLDTDRAVAERLFATASSNEDDL